MTDRLPGLAALLAPGEADTAAAVTQDVVSSSRPVDAATMFERVRPYLADYGITRVADLSGLDRLGLPVHTAYKPAGRTLSSGSGKGVTEIQSRLGAVMEAIEQTLWEAATAPLVYGTSAQLEGMGLTAADASGIARIRGGIWHEGLAISWVPMIDLMTAEEVWVPMNAVVLPRPASSSRRPFELSAFVPSSNGLASGYHVADALVSALTEVLERDAVTIAKLTGVAEVDSAELVGRIGGEVATLAERIGARGMALSITDATSEAGLPTYVASLWDLEEPRNGLYGGYGTGFDEQRGLVRAITEAVQGRELIIAGARDDIYGRERRASRRRTNSRRRPAEGSPAPVRPGTAPTDSVTALEQLVAAVRRCGAQRVLIHRYSQPGDPAQVVRVVVPGLEGYKYSGYLPGPRALRKLAQHQIDTAGVQQ